MSSTNEKSKTGNLKLKNPLITHGEKGILLCLNK
jgi:hypothetical protein